MMTIRRINPNILPKTSFFGKESCLFSLPCKRHHCTWFVRLGYPLTENAENRKKLSKVFNRIHSYWMSKIEGQKNSLWQQSEPCYCEGKGDKISKNILRILGCIFCRSFDGFIVMRGLDLAFKRCKSIGLMILNGAT